MATIPIAPTKAVKGKKRKNKTKKQPKNNNKGDFYESSKIKTNETTVPIAGADHDPFFGSVSKYGAGGNHNN